MKRRLCIFALSAGIFVMIFLGGCGILLEDRTFVLSLSVDYKDGEYLVWYGTSDLSGEVSEEEENSPVKEQSENEFKGTSMEEAEKKFLSSQENELDMGHLKAVILGEGLLQNQTAYEGVLNYLEAQPAVASNVLIFQCKEIENLVQIEKEQEIPLGIYLTKMPQDKSKETVKLQEVYRLWYSQKTQPVFPEIKIWQKKIVVQNKSEE